MAVREKSFTAFLRRLSAKKTVNNDTINIGSFE